MRFEELNGTVAGNLGMHFQDHSQYLLNHLFFKNETKITALISAILQKFYLKDVQKADLQLQHRLVHTFVFVVVSVIVEQWLSILSLRLSGVVSDVEQSFFKVTA